MPWSFTAVWALNDVAGQQELGPKGPAAMLPLSPIRCFLINLNRTFRLLIKRPARDACLCMGELQAPAAPAAPHFVFLITL